MNDEMRIIRVVKRDGRIEDYDEDKIAKICEALGLSPNQEQYLLTNVANKVRNNASGEMISSGKIRKYVTEELKEIDEYAAKQFTWYYKMNKASEK